MAEKGGPDFFHGRDRKEGLKKEKWAVQHPKRICGASDQKKRVGWSHQARGGKKEEKGGVQ